jgi:flagellar biosynthesis chaperone FliJ
MTAAYPLQALRSLRADEEEHARRSLAEAISQLELASRGREAASVAVASHREATARTLAAEAARAPSVVRVDDAIHARAWRERRGAELVRLESALGESRRVEAEAERALEAARESLASASREREAIEKHHARWLDERRRLAEAREEAESEDRRR